MPQLLRSALLLLLATLAALLLSAGFAQRPEGPGNHVRIGVLVPGSGSGSLEARLAARAWEGLLRSSGRGITVELLIRDGGTTAADTTAQLRQLVETDEVHGVVCCVTPASVEAASAFAGRLPVLALSRPAAEPAPADAPLLLPPAPLAIGRAVAADATRFNGGLGLLTSDDDYGAVRSTAARAGALEAGIPLTESAQYRPGARALTPEALLVAASGAESILVWPLPGDLNGALEALEARGWSGPLYIPLDLAGELPGGLRNGRLRDVLVPVPPVLLEGVPTAERLNGPAVYRFEQALRQTYGRYSPSAEGALAFDALDLLLRGAEQALTYGVSAGNVNSFRQAILDGMVAQGVLTGAAGSYRFDGRDPDLALQQGIAIARLSAGRPVPASR